jgi:hypothetical protein
MKNLVNRLGVILWKILVSLPVTIRKNRVSFLESLPGKNRLSLLGKSPVRNRWMSREKILVNPLVSIHWMNLVPILRETEATRSGMSAA